MRRRCDCADFHRLQDESNTGQTQRDLHNKVLNGSASRIIVAREGIHKLPHSCRVYTDGCGFTNHVRDAVSTLGTDHQFAPPHQQALNEAEKVADTGTVCARADAQPSLTTMLRTTYFRSWLITQCTLTSGLQQLPIAIEDGRLHVYELSRSTQPPIIKLHRPFTHDVSYKYQNPNANS